MKALIVTDNDKKISSYLDAVSFFNYLVNEVGMTKDDIYFYGSAEYRAKLNFHNIFFHVCELSANEPLIVYYSGHGSRFGWDFSEDLFISYEELVGFLMLKPRKAPLILINDCCFGMAVVDYLKELKIKKTVFGLSPKDFVGQNDESGSFLLPELFKYWRKGKLAAPSFKIKIDGKDLPDDFKEELKKEAMSMEKIDLRYGDNLDYLLFPQKNNATRFYQASQLFLKILHLFGELLACLKR
jgi:hypothetical protein